MKKQDINVAELVGMVERQELQLPEIQRQYVWQAPRVRDLLDSLYRGYPSGSILVWETDQPIPTRAVAVDQTPTPFEGQKLLLDGQQRLTSLAAVLGGRQVHVRGRRRPVDILFNLDHPDGPPVEVPDVEGDAEPLLTDGEDVDSVDPDAEDDTGDRPDLRERLGRRTFVVASQALAQQPNWVSVTKVFAGESDAAIMRRAGLTGFDDPRYERYKQRLERLRGIRQYMYVMHVLGRDLSYEEVTEIFVRVNSLGVKLRSSDLALAQVTARWRTFLNVVEAFQARFERQGWVLDTGLLVRTMIVFATKQAKFQRVGGIRLDELQRGWREAEQGLTFAVNFLRSNAGVEAPSLLSAPTLLIPVAVLSRLRDERLSADEERELAYWLHVANARGRYSRGSSETLLNEDLAILFHRRGTPADLLEPIRRVFGRLHIEPADLAGRPAQSPLFPLAYMTVRALGAKDWQTGIGIQLGAAGRQHLVQYHHVFPKALLKERGYEGAETNEVANLAFIAGRTNQRIGRRSPADYLPDVVELRGEEALRAQLIPTDPELWRPENYRRFLAARRELLADAINAHVEQLRTGQRRALPDPVRSQATSADGVVAPVAASDVRDGVGLASGTEGAPTLESPHTAPRRRTGTRNGVRRDSDGIITNAEVLDVGAVAGERVLCPACRAKIFDRWPLGWDAHAAHACRGLAPGDGEARKAEFRARFARLFRDGDAALRQEDDDANGAPGPAGTQRDVMRVIWDRCGHDWERAAQEFADAERRGVVTRRRNANGVSPEAYARWLLADGRTRGWLPAPPGGWPA